MGRFLQAVKRLLIWCWKRIRSKKLNPENVVRTKPNITPDEEEMLMRDLLKVLKKKPTAGKGRNRK